MLNLSKRQLAILSLISANFIWGASFPIYKWALTTIPPFTFVYLRFFLGSLIILPFVYKNLKIEKKDIPKMIGYSFTGITLAISFLFSGLRLAPSINVPIIYSAGPVILVLISILYLHDKPKRKVIAGTLVSMIGVLVIVLRPIFEHGLNLTILGNILFFFGCASDSISIVVLEKISKKYSPLTVVFWSFIIGCIPLLPFVAIEQFHTPLLAGIAAKGFVGLFYGVFLAAAGAHLLFAFGTKYILTQEVGIFAYVDPISTALIAIPLLGEQITFYYLLGAIFVFSGIFIAENRLHYHPFHLLKERQN